MADKWWATRDFGGTEHIVISVVNFHNDVSKMLGDEIDVRHVWSRDLALSTEDAMRVVGIDDELAHKVLRTVLDDVTMGYGNVMEPFPLREDPLDTMQDAWIITGPTETVKKYVLRALEDTAESSKVVSGDDDYFDYYPDAMDVMLQLCVALGLEEAYRHAYEKVHSPGYGYHEPIEDVIPHWPNSTT